MRFSFIRPPTTCIPIGRLSLLLVTGMLAAGFPVRLKIYVNGVQSQKGLPHLMPLISSGYSLILNGFTAMVGVINKS